NAIKPLFEMMPLVQKPQLGHAIIDAFGAIKPASPETRSQLLTFLHGSNRLLQIRAAAALVRLEKDTKEAKEAFEVLATGLQDKDREVRAHATYVVKELGAAAAPLAPTDAAMLSSTDESNQRDALELIAALKEAGGDAVPAVTDYLRKGDKPVAALETLRKL